MATKAVRSTLASRLSERLGVHYGWLVLVVTLLTLLVASAVRQVPGVVIKPLEAEFGWDRASISLAVAIGWLINGLGGPYGARLVERFGPRASTLAAILVTLVCVVATTLMQSVLEFTLWYGLGIGFSTGLLSMVFGAIVANRWFAARRGLATGLLGAGLSAGQLVFVPLMMAVTVAIDWRAAFGVLALGLGIICLPLVFLVMRDSPADVGLRPYGARADQPIQSTNLSGPLVTPSQAVRTLDFWLLASSFFVCGVTTSGLIGTHLVPHAVEHGFSESTAAWSLALIGAMNVIGTTMSGYLTDRFNPRLLLAAYYGLRALSLVLLPLVSDVVGLTAFAIIFGLDFLATVPPTVALTADRFGQRSVGLLYGWITFSHQLGSALAAWGGGLIYTMLGDYQVAFLAGGTLGFIAALMSLQVAPKRRAPVAELAT